MPSLQDVQVELDRVVDRLDTMPIGRAESASGACFDAAALIVARTRELGHDVPTDAVLPRLGPQALGSMLAVLGRDYAQAASRVPGTDVTEVLEILTALRRGLP